MNAISNVTETTQSSTNNSNNTTSPAASSVVVPLPVTPPSGDVLGAGIPMPGAQTLRDVPRRVFTFLITVGRQPTICKTLGQHGYTVSDHEEGWRLLNKAGSHLTFESDTPMDVALRELDAWDEVGFHKAHAALVVDYPNQAEFVFQGLAPRQGPEAVLGVVQFLDRLDMLEKGERGEATREADADAVRELGRRGIGADERARLRALVLVAQSSAATLVDPAAQDAEQHTKDLFALYCWYQRWTEIARAVVKGRTAALALGLAHRRSARVATDPEVGAPIAQPQAPVPAPSPAPAATSPSANGAIVPSA